MRWLGRLARALPAFVAILPFAVSVLAHLDFVPLWDGVVYSQCIHNAVSSHDVESLMCQGHSSVVYFGIVAAFSAIAHEAPVATILVNLGLGIAAILAFLRIARLLFPESELVERTLLATAFSAGPVLVANALNLSPDYGMAVFSLLALLGLLERRRALTVIGGLGMTFSKEPGIALFAVAAGAYLLTYGRRPSPAWTGWRDAIRFHLPLLGVPAALILYLGGRALAHLPLVWNAAVGAHSGINPFQVTDRTFISYLALAFVLNFAWLPALLAALFGLRSLGSRLLHHPRPWLRWQITSDAGARGWFLWLVLAGDLYMLTRVRTFSIPRYFLALSPILLLTAWHSALALRIWRRGREVMLAAYVALLLVSTYHTIDPLSKRIYGTFAFGDHSLLTMTSITHEGFGYGRDQLVYNLQFTEIHSLLNDVLGDLRPKAPALVVVPFLSWDAEVLPAVDSQHSHRDLPRAGTDSLYVREEIELALGHVKPLPPVIYYIELPYIDTSIVTGGLANLRLGYDLTGSRLYQRDGYALRVDTLVLPTGTGR